MDYYNLHEFQEEISILEEFFNELGAREEEIQVFGFRRVEHWESYQKALNVFNNFERQIHNFLSFARFYDKHIYENAIHLLKETRIGESLASIQVFLQIESARKPFVTGSIVVTALHRYSLALGITSRKRIFSNESFSVHKVLVALGRLKSFVGIIDDVYVQRIGEDNNVFKPSNLNEEAILTHIEAAIDQIEQNISIPQNHKDQLLAFLQKAKNELAGNKKSWNKIVGALVITATITAGIASAPEAYKNIDAALKYILGTSIDRDVFNPAPLLHDMAVEPSDSEIA